MNKKILKKNSEWKANLLIPYLKSNEKVLDFGCGDLTLAKSILKKKRNLSISGVDVVAFNNASQSIPFYLYDGAKLPFKDNEFDTVISFYVFHHCKSAEKAFLECMRVAKRVILVESIPRTPLEVPIMKFLDWLFNVWKGEKIDLPFQFYPSKKWNKIFKKAKAKSFVSEINNGVMKYMPIGGQYLFEVRKS